MKSVEETCPRCHGWVWHRSEPCNCKPAVVSEFNYTQGLLDLIGRRVRALREAKRLSLDELAERACMSKTGLWEIEQGKNEPRAFTVIALAEALETTTDYLLRGEAL